MTTNTTTLKLKTTEGEALLAGLSQLRITI